MTLKSKHLLALFLFGMLHLPVFGQQRVVDSLLRVLSTLKEDTNKVALLSRLCWEYNAVGKFEEGIQTGKAALKLAQTVAVGKQTGWSRGITWANVNLSQIYRKEGDLDKSLACLFEAIKGYEKNGNRKGMASAYLGLGNVYFMQNNYDLAQEKYEASLKISLKLKNKAECAPCYNNIGAIYHMRGNLEKALEMYLSALKIRQETGNIREVASSYLNLAVICTEKKEYDQAFEYTDLALKMGEKSGNKNTVATAHYNFGKLYLKQHKQTEAKSQFQLELKVGKEIGSKEHIEEGYEGLSKCDSALGKWREAFEYHKLFKQYHDSMFSAESAGKSAEMNARYESGKKESQIQLMEKETEKRAAVSLADNKRHQTTLFFFIAGLLIMILFSVFMFNRWRITQKQKKIIEIQKKRGDEQNALVENQKYILEEKNKDIIDSINYAKRIQDALLKEEEHVSAHLPEHFILFKPKDIVSGDFYWALEMKNCFYLAAVDCTGHGVPGAFMSMLGISFLNEITAVNPGITPAEILNQLRSKIVKELGQTGKTGGNKDGMDISLACLNLETKQLQWAGANNPLYMICKGELSQLKPKKQPIGYIENMTPFDNQVLMLEKGTTIYLFTDGYADQFGGENGKKFKYAQLQRVLLSLNQKPMSTQKQLLNELFEAWKGNLEQVDDVCLIGLTV